VRYQISGLEGASLHGMEEEVVIEPGRVIPVTALVRAPESVIEEGLAPIEFSAEVIEQPQLNTTYQSMFMGPK
jgi:hypothetical protein